MRQSKPYSAGNKSADSSPAFQVSIDPEDLNGQGFNSVYENTDQTAAGVQILDVCVNAASCYAHIQSLSAAILNLAENGDWEGAIALQAERKISLQQVFSQKQSLLDDQQMGDWINEILSNDQRVLALARNEQTKCFQQHKQTQQQFNNVKRYLQ